MTIGTQLLLRSALLPDTTHARIPLILAIAMRPWRLARRTMATQEPVPDWRRGEAHPRLGY